MNSRIIFQLLCSLFFFSILLLGCENADIEAKNPPPNKIVNENGEIKILPEQNKLSAISGEEFTYTPKTETKGKNVKATFSLGDNPPQEMKIDTLTGKVQWTPSLSQGKKEKFTIQVKLGKEIIRQEFNVSVFVKKYVIPTGTGDGTKKTTPTNLEAIAKVSNPGDIIYLTGGTYTYTTTENAIKFSSSGEEDLPIILRNPPGEQTKITFQGKTAVVLEGDHLTLEGVEIEGPAQTVTYTKAVSNWWGNGPEDAKVNGKGVIIRGNYVTVKDCYIHDISSAGINIGGDYHSIVIEGNVLQNICWWTYGGSSAISCNYLPIGATDDSSPLKIIGNLILNSEQRIFSHVFNKGFADLAVDEGGGILVQNSKDEENGGALNPSDVKGRQLVTDNIVMYSAKAITFNKSVNAEALRNVSYGNGVNLDGTSAGFRGNGMINCVWKENIVQVDTGLKAFSFSKESTFTGDQNYAIWPSYRQQFDEVKGVNVVSSLFENPKELNFNNPYGVGIDTAVLNDLKAKVRKYKIIIAPSEYVINRKQMVKDIINNKPQDPQSVGIKNPSKFYFVMHAEHAPDGVTLDDKHRYYLFK